MNNLLKEYYWEGNTRQLSRIISTLSDFKTGIIDEKIISSILPAKSENIGMIFTNAFEDLVKEVGLIKALDKAKKDYINKLAKIDIPDQKKAEIYGISRTTLHRARKKIERRETLQ